MTKSIAQRQLEELGEEIPAAEVKPKRRLPKKQLSTIRGVLVSFRLKDKESKKLHKHAAANDENVSDFIRRKLSEFLR